MMRGHAVFFASLLRQVAALRYVSVWPFKRKLGIRAQDNLMHSHLKMTLTTYDLPGIVKEYNPKVATPINIVNGFNVSGVHSHYPTFSTSLNLHRAMLLIDWIQH